MDPLPPKDHAEAIALHRSQVIGSLTARQLDRGELAQEPQRLSTQRFRAPRSHSSRSDSVSTLERWYYAYKQGGLEALRPDARSDKGRGRNLPPELRELLLGIRREHPSASVPLISRTLVAEGRMQGASTFSARSARCTTSTCGSSPSSTSITITCPIHL